MKLKTQYTVGYRWVNGDNVLGDYLIAVDSISTLKHARKIRGIKQKWSDKEYKRPYQWPQKWIIVQTREVV